MMLRVITRNAGMNGERATTVNGKGRDITTNDLVAVGVQAGMSQSVAISILEQIQQTVNSLVIDG